MKRINDIFLVKLLSVICLLAVFAAGFLVFGKKQVTEEFIPPSFDDSAVSGVPSVSDDLWKELETDAFTVAVCNRIYVTGDYARVIFYNSSGNDCLLKLRMLDSDGSVIAETGLIKPYEYISDVYLQKKPYDDGKVILKIMAYEPDTYYSAGAVSVNADIFV